jgi:steroid 5-alpha reductase family enzyme
MYFQQILTLAIAGTAMSTLLMLVLWLVYWRKDNPAVVDPGWAGALGLLAILYAILGDGYLPRKIMIAVMAGFWGFRLSGYLLMTRVLGGHRDGRYDTLQQTWKTNLRMKFLFFFEFQALLAALLSLPFLFVATNQQSGFSPLEYVAMGIWLVAILGETIADNQLNAFKRDPENRGKVCRVGLWNYSRHPNYFFEWLVWVAFFLAALASPYGWIAIYCPALMLYFLFRVTGIPMTEEQSIRTKGDAYREYQKTTSAFVPWLKKKSTTLSLSH